MEWSEISQAFRNKADKIYKHLTTNVKPMNLNGTILNGALFTTYVDSLVNQINNGALPHIEKTYQYVC